MKDYTLDQIPNFQLIEVVGIDGEASLVERLLELGLASGVTLSVRGRAPLGGPLLIDLHASTLALREAEARCVKVRLL